jgi:hypothetical protein
MLKCSTWRGLTRIGKAFARRWRPCALGRGGAHPDPSDEFSIRRPRKRGSLRQSSLQRKPVAPRFCISVASPCLSRITRGTLERYHSTEHKPIIYTRLPDNEALWCRDGHSLAVARNPQHNPERVSSLTSHSTRYREDGGDRRGRTCLRVCRRGVVYMPTVGRQGETGGGRMESSARKDGCSTGMFSPRRDQIMGSHSESRRGST